jgi:hypothetical protein
VFHLRGEGLRRSATEEQTSSITKTASGSTAEFSFHLEESSLRGATPV